MRRQRESSKVPVGDSCDWYTLPLCLWLSGIVEPKFPWGSVNFVGPYDQLTGYFFASLVLTFPSYWHILWAWFFLWCYCLCHFQSRYKMPRYLGIVRIEAPSEQRVLLALWVATPPQDWASPRQGHLPVTDAQNNPFTRIEYGRQPNRFALVLH